jgi:hypothetical protein
MEDNNSYFIDYHMAVHKAEQIFFLNIKIYSFRSILQIEAWKATRWLQR